MRYKQFIWSYCEKMMNWWLRLSNFLFKKKWTNKRNIYTTFMTFKGLCSVWKLKKNLNEKHYCWKFYKMHVQPLSCAYTNVHVHTWLYQAISLVDSVESYLNHIYAGFQTLFLFFSVTFGIICLFLLQFH